MTALVSKTVIRLGLLNRHCIEAMLLGGRSLRLWRCEVLQDGISDIEEIWSGLNAMLCKFNAINKHGS